MATKRKADAPPELTDRTAKLMRFRGDSSDSESSPEPQFPEPPSSPMAAAPASPTASSASSPSGLDSSSNASVSSSPAASPSPEPDTDDEVDSDLESGSDSDETSSSSASANYEVTLHFQDTSDEDNTTQEATLLGTYPSATAANHVARQVIPERLSGTQSVKSTEVVEDGLVKVEADFSEHKKATITVKRVEK